MISSEREKLFGRRGEYLSIGITEDGVPPCATGVPWERTAHAFNMRLPDIYLAVEDLSDKEIMDRVRSFTVIGCYICAPLDDYRFIAELNDLQDIYIKKGDGIKELSFLEGKGSCRMLYLQNASLKDLEIIVSQKKNAVSISRCFSCLCLDNCTVDDLSCLEEQGVFFSELIVINPKSRSQEHRWRGAHAAVKRYYEYEG